MTPSRFGSARLESRRETELRRVFLGPLVEIVRAHDLEYSSEDDPVYRRADLESHLNYVAVVSWIIGERSGLSRKERYLLALAALMHDLGKTERVEYLQRAPFTPEQKRRKREHAEVSRQRMRERIEKVRNPRIRELLQSLLVPITHHHEPWKALIEEQDERGALMALVMNLADAYCAMTEEGRGQDHLPKTPAQAVAILENQVATWPEYAAFEPGLPERVVAALRHHFVDG
jgi:response regulator RpfG family c-di-GMP phosphodiesterase